MNPVEEILMIVGMMVATYGVRYGFLALSGRAQLPKTIEDALRFVPVAVLSALSVPLIIKPAGSWFISFDNAHLVAGVVAIIVAAYSRHLLLTIVLGMGLFLVLHLNLLEQLL